MNDKMMCAGCNRRDFLSKLGVLAGVGAMSSDLLAVLPPPVSPKMIPDKTGAKKVRLIFGYHPGGEIQKRPDWPNVGYDFRPAMKNITDTLNWQVKGIEFLPVHCAGEAETAKLMEKDNKNDEIVGYAIVNLNCWSTCIFAWNRTEKAIFYTPLPYAGDGGWLRDNGNLRNWKKPHVVSFAALDFSKVTAVAKAFEVFAAGGTVADFKAKGEQLRAALIPPDTPPANIAVVEDKVNCRTPEETLAAIKGFKILSVEANPSARYVREFHDTFGVAIERVPFDEVNAACRAADEAEARKVRDQWKAKAARVEYVEDETLLGCAKMYIGMRETLKRHGAYAITINCLGGCYSGKLDAYPCLGFMQLQDEGLMGVCENDLRSTLTMIVFQALARGRVGYVSDPILDMPNRAISYAHCVSTRRFFGKDGPEHPFEILTHSEDRMGASVRAFAPVGYPVTTVELNPGTRSVSLHTGVIVANDTDDRACRTKIVARVTGDYSKIEGTWPKYGWHRVTFVGDFRKDVEAFAAKIGYKVDYES